jgi:uncharacterized membrane protein YtjA (UPF0391 family)
MAKYRVDDKDLSKKNHRVHESYDWRVGLFLIGSFVVGYFANLWLSSFGMIKEFRFALILLIAIPSGYLASRLNNIAQIVVFLIIILFLVSLVLGIVWDIL